MGEMEMSEQLDLDALELLLKTATKGPWKAMPPRIGAAITVYAGDVPVVTTCSNTSPATMGMHRRGEVKANAEFVAIAREAIPALIARIRALESRASNACGAVYQALDVDTCTWEDVTAEYYAERLPSNRRILYTHPAPASKEPVADERAAFEAIAKDQCLPLRRTGCTYDDDATQAAWAVYLQARAALATAQTWQPIETAPKEKNPMIVVCSVFSNGYVTDPWCVWWQGGGWKRWPRDEQPTHWMPLPAAPAKPEGA